MTENTFQHNLRELRAQIITLQQISDDDVRQVKTLLPGVLVALQRTLEELHSIAAELPEAQHTASIAACTKQREASIDAPTSPPASTVSDTAGRELAEQKVRMYQERVRSLMADLLLAEELERRRLAVDLHDGLSQTIALTRIKLAALRRSMDGKLNQDLDEIDALIDQTNRTARSISFELSPLVLHDLGLEPALQWLVENIESRYGIEIVLEDDGKPKPADEKTRVILFRSIRELLINAAKHAKAHRVHVRLQREKHQLKVLVEDDGVGLEPQEATAKGTGLFSIRERLSHVGGSMRIESAPGLGTKIRLCAPLTNIGSTKTRLEA